MIVQIYTMQSAQEARALADLGVNHLGLTVSSRNLPGEIDAQTAREIIAAVGGRAKMVALSVESDLDEIVAMTQAVQPDILHLCGDLQAVPPEAVRDLRARLPGVEIMQAIPVGGPESIEQMLAFEPVADYFLLDSAWVELNVVGATGKTHDWNVSREIVARSSKPVILAGGLSPENVTEAIRQVRPWGVDSLTHTNFALGGGRFRKDIERVRAFVQAARTV
jgi:phosphoribosylanthranilate isomerase